MGVTPVCKAELGSVPYFDSSVLWIKWIEHKCGAKQSKPLNIPLLPLSRTQLLAASGPSMLDEEFKKQRATLVRDLARNHSIHLLSSACCLAESYETDERRSFSTFFDL